MSEKATLRKASGVCAILAAVAAIVGFALFLVTDVRGIEDAIETLPVYDEDKALTGASIWLFILASVLYLVALPGIFQVLREAGDVMWIAVMASVVGVVFVIASGVISLAVVYEVATPYVEAGPGARGELLVLGDALITMSWVALLLGRAIEFGIGVLLFSIAILKTGFVPIWVGLLGLIVAVSAWLGLLRLASDEFPRTGFFTIAFFVWLAAVGVVLLRQPKQTVSATPRS